MIFGRRRAKNRVMERSTAEAAFVERLARHRGIPRKVASAYCRNPADREDCAAEIVAQLWRSYPRYDPARAFSTWAWRIAVNVAISYYRRGRTESERAVAVDGGTLDRIADPEPGTDASLDRLHELVARLDEFDRALVVLYLDDRPYAEIADVLGITPTNVATKLNRIKTRMKEWSRTWTSTN